MTTASDDGQRAQALLEKGAGLYEEGKLYEAISCWRKVLAIDPDNEIAAEYLRFIEDNFQIGIDSFLEHHQKNPDDAAFGGGDDDLAAAIDDSINAMLDESIEELDWSELLDEPIAQLVAPPPSEVAEVDEAFFAALEPGSLQSTPGAEAAAWGRSLLSSGSASNSSAPKFMSESSMDMMPEGDPFTLPIDRFAMDYTAGEFEVAEADAEPADPLAEAPAVEAVTGPSAEQRHRTDRPRRRKDLADMSEDSIDSLLDEDFRAWEKGTAEDEAPADSYELPFETPGASSPRHAAAPTARPSKPSLDADGRPVERRRTPPLEGDPPSAPIPNLERYTGPLEAVDPHRRSALGGVERVSRTTPPTPVRLPPEAMPDLSASAAGASAELNPPPRGTPKERASGPAGSAERRSAADSLEGKETAQASQPSRSPETPVEPIPSTAAPSTKTDLDDELRALLTAGIAEIEAVERPVVRPRRLIQAPPPGTDLDALMVDARRRQQADDFSGAIELVEQVLAGNPEHREARRYLEANTDRLLSLYRARLGSLGRVPRVKLRQQEIVWQSLDHREGFILSQIDGRTSFEDIIDIAGMPVLDSTRILARLVDHGVIG